MAAPASFVWGDGGAQMTPEQIAAQRKVAQALLEKGMDYSPVQSGWQGAARVSQALMGGLEGAQADAADKANAASNKEMIAALLAGGGVTGASPAASSAPTVVTPSGPPPIPAQALSGDSLSSQPAPLSGGFAAASPDAKTDPQAYAMSFFQNKGYSPVQAAGIVGGLKGETANLNTAQVHDGGIGLGIAGWNGPRLKNLQAFAQAKGTDPTDLNTQLEFVDNELKSSESGAYRGLQSAQTPQQAGQAMLSYFRPKDWNVPGAHPERARYAGDTFQRYGGGTQVASLDPSIGLGAAMSPKPSMPPDALAFNGQAQPGNPLSDVSSFAPQPSGAGGMTPSPSGQPNITTLRTRQVAPNVAGQTPAPVQAPQAAVAPSARGSLAGVNPALIQAVTSPYASEGTKKIATMLLQQKLGEAGVTHVDAGNAIIVMDKNGNEVRRIAKGEPNKGPEMVDGPVDPTTGEKTRGIWDARTKTFEPIRLPAAAGAAPSTIPPAPPGVDPKVWRESFSKRATADAQPAAFDDTAKVRGEVTQLPSYKNVAQAAPIYRSMVDAAGRDSKASDLNLVYGLGKIMDPGSVVREGEMVMVKNSAGLPEWFLGAVNALNGGAALTPETRTAIMREAHGRMQSYKGLFDQDASMYRGIAKRSRMNEEDVIPNFGSFEPWAPPAKPGAPVEIDGYKIKAR